MTITFELPEEVAANLRAQAIAQGRTAAELATEVVIERFGTDYEAKEFFLDGDALEKLRRGFADMDAGRTVSLEDSRAKIESLLAARHGTADA